MAQSTYVDALACLLANEGGYTNHPADPGGPTNFGITIDDYRKYVKPDATAADMRAMKVEDAKSIYRVRYWDAQRCDELPAGVDYAVFDYGVNSGIGRSGKVLRRCLRLADNNSVVSDSVIAAARQADAKMLIGAICDERLRFLRSLRTWPVFGKGWGRRVAEVRVFALKLAVKQQPPLIPVLGSGLWPARAQAPAGIQNGGATPDGPGSPLSAFALRASADSKPVEAREASIGGSRGRAENVSGKGVLPPPAVAQRATAGTVIAAGTMVAHQAHQHGADPAIVAGLIMMIVLAAVCAWRFWAWRQQRLQERRS